jgi:hypothetical protein
MMPGYYVLGDSMTGSERGTTDLFSAEAGKDCGGTVTSSEQAQLVFVFVEFPTPLQSKILSASRIDDPQTSNKAPRPTDAEVEGTARVGMQTFTEIGIGDNFILAP